MDLSIIIVNWNTRDYLEKCLESIQAHPASAVQEVIVVDNASADGSAQMVQERFPHVTLIRNSENAGYAMANNQAIELSNADFVLLLNPDTQITSGALDVLLKFARTHPDAAAVGCRLISPDGKVQSSCRSFPDPMPVLFEYLKLSYLFPKSKKIGAYRMTYFDYAQEAEVDQPMASCLLISKTALDDIGKFDQDFPVFFNEVDWCYRAKQKGWKVFFTPSAEVIHEGGASTRQVKPAMRKESHRALRKFYEKHYKKRLWPPVYWFIVGAININGAK